MNYITVDQYMTLVAAAVSGLVQNPAIMNYPDAYQIQDITVKCMQGVEQAIQQSGSMITTDSPA